MCFHYLLGLLETDGSFHLILKADSSMKIGYRVEPEVPWSQRKKSLLESAGERLRQQGIKSPLDSSASQLGGGRQKVCGIRPSALLMAAIDGPCYSTGGKTSGLSPDEESPVMEGGFHNTPQGRRQMIHIKFALHLSPPHLHNHPPGGVEGKSRVVWGGQWHRFGSCATGGIPLWEALPT